MVSENCAIMCHGHMAAESHVALLQFFQFLELKDKVGTLRSCVLVSRAWSAAAVAATQVIELERCADTGSLQLYLKHHGQHVTKLHAREAELIELCCPGLTSLLLSGSSKKLTNSKLCSDIAAATALTRLCIPDVTLLNCSQQLLSTLAGLPSLQHLVLQSLNVLHARYLLPACTHLTHFECQHGLPGSALQYLSTLTYLQHLVIGTCMGSGPPLITALQCLTKLTHLEIHNINCHLTCSLLPRFSALTALQHLSFSTAKRNDNPWPRVYELEPAILPVPPQLKHLKVRQVNLDINTTRGSDFLAWSAKLEHLTHLSLHNMSGTDNCPAQAHAALTASSSLQHLSISALYMTDHWEGFLWRSVFPLGKQLPQLHTLQLISVSPPLRTVDLQNIMRCCPALRALDVRASCADGSIGVGAADLTALTQLSALTSFCADEVSDQDITNSIARLTGLQRLCFDQYCAELSDEGLRQLTVLRQLACLGFGRCFESGRVSWQVMQHMTDPVPDMHWAITSKAPAGHPPDVWRQLAALFEPRQQGSLGAESR